MTKIATSAVDHDHRDDTVYSNFLARIVARLQANVAGGERPLFTTDAGDLWTAYLGAFRDPEDRQYHNCNACRHFITRFGGLVTIDTFGKVESALWNENDAPTHYKPAVAALARAAAKGKVTGVFLSADRVLGTPDAGGWSHLHAKLPASMVHKRVDLTAGQLMAEKREDFKNVLRALGEFTPAVVDMAVRVLESEQLYRSEKVIGPAQWLQNLHRGRAAVKGQAKQNVLWLAIAQAPAGFCHPRSSMIGTLLEDIVAGKNFTEVKRAFAAKMDPLKYQRPTAPPAAGNVAQAEGLFQRLGLAPALKRRFARFDEVPKVWEPKAPKEPEAAGGLFGHLKTKGAHTAPPPMELPKITMTLQKFCQRVAPLAQEIEVLLPNGRMPLIMLTTAVEPDAPRLFQWDHPFSWFVQPGGSYGGNYGLHAGWTRVAGITRLPARWGDDANAFEHRGDGLVLLLNGATARAADFLALFPEQLRTELHGVRATIEAHSMSGRLEEPGGMAAIGIDLRKPARDAAYPCRVRVLIDGAWQAYEIDRWD